MPIFRERELHFMLRQSAARVLVVPDASAATTTRRSRAACRPTLADLEHVIVVGDTIHSSAARRRRGRPDAIAARRPTSEPTAQLLFTSGSTGEPKGSCTLTRRCRRLRAPTSVTSAWTRTTSSTCPRRLPIRPASCTGCGSRCQLGVPQVLQATWNPDLGFDAIQRSGVTFVQAATPFLADLVARRPRTPADAGAAADIRRHRGRDPA